MRRKRDAASVAGMTVLRVRVEVADVPGALAGLTAALAALEVDLSSIDVLEVDGRSVVDELLLRLPPAVAVQEVHDALRLAGADVLSSVVASPRRDPVVAAFELVRGVVEAPDDADAPGRAVARAAYGDVGALLEVDVAARFPLARRALEGGVPASAPASPDVSPLAVSGGWVLWVAPQLLDPQHVAVVGRRLNVRFSATEAARLRALVTLLASLDRAGMTATSA